MLERKTGEADMEPVRVSTAVEWSAPGLTLRPASSQIHRRRKSLENLWFSSDLLFAQQTYRRLLSLSKMSVKDFFDKLREERKLP